MPTLDRKDTAEYTPAQLAVDTTLRGILSPTGLSDVEATKLGFKVYSHGTSYNGGNSPTITLTAGSGLVVQSCRFIPYQVQDGSWRLKLNTYLTQTSAGSMQWAIAGVTFPTGNNSANPIAGGNQQLAVGIPSTSLSRYAIADGPSIVHSADSTFSGGIYSGDVAIVSKPNWAY